MKKALSFIHTRASLLKDRAFRIHRIEPLAFPVLLILYFVLSSFGELVDDVLEGDMQKIDQAVLQKLRDPQDMANPLGPPWVTEIMRDFSALGGIAILTLLTISAALYLFIRRKHFRGIFLLLSVGTGVALSNIMKAGFDRPRPDLVPHETHTFTASFPSGHSLMATVVYLTLGGLLADNETEKRMKLFIVLLACLLAFLVGISRIYLGAHWMSDVLAGWLAGSAWALLFWLLERYLLYRRQSRAAETPTN